MKTQLLTISAFAMLLAGQSAMAFEQINAENGYDAAFQNGWVDSATSNNLDVMKASYRSQISNDNSSFEDVLSLDYSSQQ